MSNHLAYIVIQWNPENLNYDIKHWSNTYEDAIRMYKKFPKGKLFIEYSEVNRAETKSLITRLLAQSLSKNKG